MARSESWLWLLAKTKVDLAVITFVGAREAIGPSGHLLFESPDPEYEFALLHNALNTSKQPTENTYETTCNIHPTAIIGAEGSKFVRPVIGGEPVRVKHMGNVTIRSGCDIGPFSVIHRATLDSTILKENCKIGSLCSVGHNSQIGLRTILTGRVTIAGSVTVGDGCYFGVGSIVVDSVSICDRVKIGAGTLVTKTLDRPGEYRGVPAKWVKEWDGKW